MDKLLVAAGLALAMVSASASTWDIHYAGMPWTGGGAGASATMDLVFSGVDGNHDGMLSASELTNLSFTLTVDGSGISTVYPVLPVVSLTPCGPHSECHSTLDAFAFNTSGRTLAQVNAAGLADPEDFLAFDGTTVNVYGRAFWDASHATVTVTDEGGPNPVPEPANAILLFAGLLVFKAARLRVLPSA